MTFNFTHGKTAKYEVIINRWNTVDRCYFSTLKAAREFFEKQKGKEGEGTTLSLYDLKSDTRKDYYCLVENA